jgi:hypothetical protein
MTSPCALSFIIDAIVFSRNNVWDLLFQLMERGTNTLHNAFIVLFSVVIRVSTFTFICIPCE